MSESNKKVCRLQPKVVLTTSVGLLVRRRKVTVEDEYDFVVYERLGAAGGLLPQR